MRENGLASFIRVAPCETRNPGLGKVSFCPAFHGVNDLDTPRNDRDEKRCCTEDLLSSHIIGDMGKTFLCPLFFGLNQIRGELS